MALPTVESASAARPMETTLFPWMIFDMSVTSRSWPGSESGDRSACRGVTGEHRKNRNQRRHHILEVLAIVLAGRDQAIEVHGLRFMDKKRPTPL